MTPHDDAEFTALCIKLDETLKRRGSVNSISFEAYTDALQDLPYSALHNAGMDFIRNGDWFPTPKEWREAAEDHLFEDIVPLALPAPVASRDVELKTITLPNGTSVNVMISDWEFRCTACEDYGWTRAPCPGDRTCGRPFRHLAHEVVGDCPCRKTNDTYKRHHTPSVAARKAQR